MYLDKLPCVIKSALATAVLSVPLVGVSVLPSIAHAQKNSRLCYAKFSNGENRYFERQKKSFLSGSKCSEVDVFDSYSGLWIHGKNIPSTKGKGKDLTKCEEWTWHKFKIRGDVCSVMARYDVLSLSTLTKRLNKKYKNQKKK